jgi:hypothetical protein
MTTVSVAAPRAALTSGRDVAPALPHLVGLVVVRGGGAPVRQWRLPRRTTATVGRRERHGILLPAPWAPAELACFRAVEDGWLVTNASRARLVVENDWVQGGGATYKPGAVVMLQCGDHRLQWSGLDKPLAVSVTVRTRRLDDQKLAYAVDSTIDGAATGLRNQLGVVDAPMSAALRYRMAVLFRHLVEGDPEPPYVLTRRAEFLGLTEAELVDVAHRYRRRLNASGADLQSLLELGEFLVRHPEGLTRSDLDP